MRIRTLAATISLAIAIGVIPAQAQYKEMSKVEALAKDNSDQQMLTGLSMHLGVPADILMKERTSNNLSFGQLYVAHALAKAANADIGSILADSRSKLWTTIAEERKVDMKQLAADERALEDVFKKLKSSK